MAWIIPEHKLDPQQRDFIERQDYTRENIWIKGFPGSGKSVLLAYTLKQIKSRNANASAVVVVFTHSLIQMFKEAFSEMQLRNVQVQTFYDFMKSSTHYDYVLSDEVQDMVPSVLRAMKSRGNHVVVCGDENQSIYERDPKFREATVTSSEIRQLLSSSSFELGIIHRLSSSIINVIQRFLPNMNVFSAKRDLTKQSTQVRLCEANSTNEEVRYIMREAQKATRIGETAAVLIPTQKDILKFANAALVAEGKSLWPERLNQWGKLDMSNLNSYLSSNGIKLKYVGNGVGDFSSTDAKVILMTYHSSKGLDFDNVFIPFMNSSLFIVPDETLSRTLFMVAMSRSRNNLYLTYSGYKHSYLNAFASECNSINIHNALAATQNAPSPRSSNGNVFGI
jgi:superfamily I DNA/RNA helicase